MSNKLEEYQKEENQLLETILNKRFFNTFRGEVPYEKALGVELFISPECNLKCSYCYLAKHKEHLYPVEFRSHTQIVENLKILLQWFYDEGFILQSLDLFSGEIWHTTLGHNVFDILLDYIKKGLKISNIMIPTNGAYALTEDSLAKMQNYINKFSKYQSRLSLSNSIDGAPIEEQTRPQISSAEPVRDKSFYDRLFTFARKNNFGFHPMVAAESSSKWIETYEWFKEYCGRHDLAFPNSLMMLPVRNNNWDELSIKNYQDFVKYMILDFIKDADSFDEILFRLTGIRTDNISPTKEVWKNGYINTRLYIVRTSQTCSISNKLTVRLGDLAICPCHRTSYDHLLYGKFKVENEKIIGIEANNSQIATKILFGNTRTMFHGCDVCSYSSLCMKCCLGEQCESTKDLFMVDRRVCTFLKEDINNLIDIYKEIGLLNFLSNVSSKDQAYGEIQFLLEAIDQINVERSI